MNDVIVPVSRIDYTDPIADMEVVLSPPLVNAPDIWGLGAVGSTLVKETLVTRRIASRKGNVGRIFKTGPGRKKVCEYIPICN